MYSFDRIDLFLIATMFLSFILAGFGYPLPLIIAIGLFIFKN